MDMVSFLIMVVSVSLSGVMAPGPVTTAAISHGARSRWAGVWMAIGHGIVEIPLIGILLLLLEKGMQVDAMPVFVGLVGGLFLVWMGITMIRQLAKPLSEQNTITKGGPLFTGFILSAMNPYFLMWWATVGLNLAIQAREFGTTALLIFAGVHWLCDLVWLTALTWSSSAGTNFFGEKVQKVVLGVCAVVLIGFGGWFLYDALF